MPPPPPAQRPAGSSRIRDETQSEGGNLNPRETTSRTPPFATAQFHVLLNSLFKVLFNFPSRYLFAIGLEVIFSLTRSLPRTLSCTPKQLDSGEKVGATQQPPTRAYHPLRAVAPVKVDLDGPPHRDKTLPHTTFRATWRAGSSVLGSARFIRHYSGHHCCFLFLRLLICLNSAGVLACFQVEVGFVNAILLLKCQIRGAPLTSVGLADPGAGFRRQSRGSVASTLGAVINLRRRSDRVGAKTAQCSAALSERRTRRDDS